MSKFSKNQDNNSLIEKTYIKICHHTSCMKAGAKKVFEAFEKENLPEDIELEKSECQGQCSTSPTVRITPEEIWYYRVKPSDVPIIVQQHLKDGKVVQDKLNPRIHLYWKP